MIFDVCTVCCGGVRFSEFFGGATGRLWHSVFFSPFSLDIYPNYGTHWHQPREFLLQKSLTNSKLVSIKVLTRCNQTETFLLIEKTNTHCLSFLFRFVDVGGDERERKFCVSQA